MTEEEAVVEDVRTEVRYRTSTVSDRQPQSGGSTTSYIIILSCVILLLFLVVAGLCLYNRYTLAKRSIIKEAIHTQHPGEVGDPGLRGFALEGQYNPKDIERSCEFIADSCKRPAPSRNDTVAKMMTTLDAGDLEY